MSAALPVTADVVAAAHDPARAAAIADPRGDIRIGAGIAFVFFVLFLGWAAFFRLDAAATAPGVLVVSGERQTVQHRDGGVVGAIHVREGQMVKKGQLLIELSAPEVAAQARALRAQATQLLAERARLEAEQDDAAKIAAPPEFAALTGAEKQEAEAVMVRQVTELRERRAVLSAQRSALLERIGQSGQQGRGYSDQAAAAREQIRLIDEQVTAMKPLAEKGFVSKSRMRELERARAALEGQQGQYSASVASSHGAASETRLQILEAERSFHERAAADMRDVETRLGDVLPKLAAAREQLARTQIRAPATGAVVGLSVFTPGGVIGAGQRLMDVVPERQPLRIEVRIAPEDADDLQVGNKALVKFPGLHDRSLPDLEGRLTRFSADSLTDEKTGTRYFTGEVTVPGDQLAIIRAARGPDFALRAGLPAEALFPLRKRTALDYALEPLVGSFWGSFHEH
ncbi:HlyD family type I secretion periplasmic adaptor subunit [Novosphingobium naphthalenivorans]|uniref:HlyD family type I secretion periplasmic adaptor subunit n=1 Tax=Novosphingobium naphthalenivorans TaxID=273168 RepID=UPI00082F2480|nr:HlyD family type I secretion periplasmic adaptor subunit [Novosphingobium naphthalenivorans]